MSRTQIKFCSIKIDIATRKFENKLTRQRCRKKLHSLFRIISFQRIVSKWRTCISLECKTRNEKLVEITRNHQKYVFLVGRSREIPFLRHDGNDIWILEPLDGRFSPRWIAVCQRCLPKYHSIRPPLHNVTTFRAVLLDVQYSTLRLRRVFFTWNASRIYHSARHSLEFLEIKTASTSAGFTPRLNDFARERRSVNRRYLVLTL